MTTPELEPLDADIRALLDDARPVADLDAARKAAIFASVAAKLGPVPPGGGGGDGGGGAGGAAMAGAGGAKAAIALAATFVLGVAAGVAGDRALAPRAEPTPAPAPSAVIAIAPPPPESAPSSDTVPVTELPSVPAPSARPPERPADPAPSARGLAAERALLDVARGALARGEASEALAAADRHARSYPDGALVEEREAIAVKALVALGRRDEARARVTELERRFPNSLVLRAAKKAAYGSP